MNVFPWLPIVVSALSLAWPDPMPASQGDAAGTAAASAQDPLVPGPQHARLQQLAGTWDAVLIAHGPDGTEQRTKGTLTTVKLGAYHTLDSFEAEFMGMPFAGRGVNSYCPIRKRYVTHWTDSMTPFPMELVGDFDASKRELIQTGECFAPSGKLEPCRAVTRYQDDDHYTWALFGAGFDDKEAQLLKIEYTRRK